MELKNIRRLLTEEDAVTPVIGIILVVAITVILAAVVGVYGLGIGDQVQDAPPNADFDFTYNAAGDEVTIEHNGGQPIQRDNIEVVVSGSSNVDPVSPPGFPAEITSGDTAVYEFDSPADAAGETLRIVWTAPNGESSNTIGESQVPD